MKLGNFQLITIVIFIAGGVLGIMVFSGFIPIGKNKDTGPTGTVVMWGTVKTTSLSKALEDFSRANKTFVLKYIQKDPTTFDHDLLEALASGTGPDMFILSDDLILHYQDKIMPIPYASYPIASFKTVYAGIGDIYLNSKGILALPLSIDPMMMYYNRTLFNSAGIIDPPKYWNDFETMIPLLNKKDANNKLLTSTVALGQFVNINHAKDIISMLFLQAGNEIVNEKNGTFHSTLNEQDYKNPLNLPSMLSFYTSFSDPLNPLYSWNRSLPNSRDAFSAENLAIYFGYASELGYLTTKNPNQDFYIAPVPQIKNSNMKVTFGRTQAVAVSAFTKNPATALAAAGLLASGDFADKFSSSILMAPARRDLLAVKKTDAYFPVFYNSALFAKAWLDPSTGDTDAIFRRMVENVLSNNLSVANSVSDASAKLELLLGR